jgi:hypothetical protein
MHPGITMHKIPIKGGVGLLFTVGMLIIFLIRLPEARVFLALSLPVGVVVAWILRRSRQEWWPGPRGNPPANPSANRSKAG